MIAGPRALPHPPRPGSRRGMQHVFLVSRPTLSWGQQVPHHRWDEAFEVAGGPLKNSQGDFEELRGLMGWRKKEVGFPKGLRSSIYPRSS